jgi:hypothetical protein
MNEQQQGLEALQDIKRIMERSSRFISLSGWSGVAAGLCALAGAALAWNRMNNYRNTGFYSGDLDVRGGIDGKPLSYYTHELLSPLATDLLFIAVGVFVAALTLAFLFTYIRSRKSNLPIWSPTARRLMWTTLVPLVVGGIVVLNMLQMGYYAHIAPLCLIFYGLALLNGSKYTLGEVRYLGYCQVLLGLINLWKPHDGLLFWAIGFGVLHIVYGVVMWWRYERK